MSQMRQIDKDLFYASKDGDLEKAKHAIEKGANVEAADVVGLTPLHWACMKGHESIVSLLLEKGADVNAKDDSGETPLHNASFNGKEAVVSLLLEKGADVNAKNEYGRTSLHGASSTGHDSIVSLLLENGANVNVKDEDGDTPLHYASDNGHEAIVSLLLEHGADVNAKDDYGRTSLHLASRVGREAIVSLLLEKGADINAKSNDGDTPLHVASKNGYESIASLLLDNGADIYANDKNGNTPLHRACIYGHEAIVSLLLEKGADPTIMNNNGKTPLQLAQEWRNQNCAYLLTVSKNGDLEMAKWALEEGIDVNAKDDEGWTPLHVASKEGNEAVVSLLLEKGADVNAKRNDGLTPLHGVGSLGHENMFSFLLENGANPTITNYEVKTPVQIAQENNKQNCVAASKQFQPQSLLLDASKYGDLEKAKRAIESGADINAKNRNGCTPLHEACQNGHESIVSLLLEKGADVNAKDEDGWTPLHYASDKGHEAVVSLLLEKGADPTITDKNGKTPLQIAQEKSKQNCVAAIEQFQRRQQQLKEQKRQEERQRLPQEKESRLGRLLPWRRQQQQEEAAAKKKRDKHLSQQQQQDAAVKKEREELRQEREKEELERRRKEEEELAKMKLQEAEQKQREKEQAAALKKQQEELRRQREKEELERRRQEELAKTEREAEQKRLETETKKELAQKKQEAKQAAKREEQLTRQQEMENLKQLEKRYSSKFKTRASLDRELTRLQDLVNDAKGSFDPALNAEAEIAFVEHQTLLPLCQSPKYASVTDLGIKIASLEEQIMKMQIGKERTKAAKDLYEIMQRLEREQKDVLKIDPNDPMEVVLENETVEHDRQAKDTQFFETFAHAYGNRVTDDFINSFRVELQGTEESHEALMKQIEESIGGTLDAIQGLQSNLDRSLVLLAFLAKGETIPCPKLVWIDASSLQKAVESPLDDADPKAIDLYFLCEDDCTQSHPEPMTIQATKDCLKRLIPIIKVSLVALKLAGDSRGVLLPVPSIKDLDEQLCFLSKVIGHLEDDEMEELLAIAETMYSTAEDDLNSNLGDDRVKEVRQLVGESYRELSKRALNELHCKKWQPYMDPLPSLYADAQLRVKWVCKNHSAALHGARFSSSPESRVFVNTVDIAHGDVFCERESRDSFHPGNVRYRRIIKRITGRDEYSSMKKSEKIDLVNHVIDNEIKGRFIETGNDGRHFALTREEVIAKVNESLLPDRS